MKKLVYVALALVMASCGGASSDDYLETLTAQRDSLKEEREKLGAKLNEVELQIAKLDTVRKQVKVTTTNPSIQKFEHYFKVYGSIKADNNTMIYPSVSGDIKSINVEEGQFVRKGQVLLTVDSEIIMRNIEEVQTQRSLAEEVYNKQKALWDKNIGSEMDYLRAKNNLESLDSKLETLRAQLRKTKVKAPFDGTIDEIFAKSGQLVSPQMATMRIVNLDVVYLKSEIPESYINVVEKGSPVKLDFPSINLTLDTHIDETGRFINPANRTFSVRVDLENDNKSLYPNLLGILEIQDYGSDSAMVVPARLIQEDALGNTFIYVVEEEDGLSRSKIQHVSVGMTSEGLTEITGGLSAQALVIDKGSRNVSNGQLIQIMQ